eukprot:TRINITY_DN20983_c0_g1_i4.p1 TRINITY_DN20983_c0_g1~~TRINITY_DN20983_c0_g1_i4.p1  ORF type:complete len:251 (+),score=49.52 TRINITY_DN20983_c0_g1_i4:39-755(+)
MVDEAQAAAAYLELHSLRAVMEKLTQKLILEQPHDSLGFLIEELKGMKRVKEESRRIIFVTGGPGSGCNELCSQLAKEKGFVHIAVGEVLRHEAASGTTTGNAIRDSIAQGTILSGPVTSQLLRHPVLSTPEGSTILLEGFPRSIEQALQFEIQVAPCKFTIFLDCPEPTLQRRILERNKVHPRPEDSPDGLRRRLRAYQHYCLPAVEYLTALEKCHTIPADGAADSVLKIVEKLFAA